MKRKKNKILKLTKWYCETWQQWFEIMEAWPAAVAEKYLNKRDIYYQNLTHDGKTIFDMSGGGPIYIWTSARLPIARRMAILAHECIHAAHQCLLRRGVSADFNNDKAVTYLVTALIRKALGDKI